MRAYTPLTHPPTSTPLPEDQKHPPFLEPTEQCKLVVAVCSRGFGYQGEQGNTRFYMDETKQPFSHTDNCPALIYSHQPGKQRWLKTIFVSFEPSLASSTFHQPRLHII